MKSLKLLIVSYHIFIERYLKPSDRIILEEMYDKWKNIIAIVKNGFKCIGIDYTENSINILNKILPKYDIRKNYVRNLKFDSNYFIGY